MQALVPVFEETVLPHLDAAYRLARWLTRNDADAEDVVQEAFLRASPSLPHLLRRRRSSVVVDDGSRAQAFPASPHLTPRKRSVLFVFAFDAAISVCSTDMKHGLRLKISLSKHFAFGDFRSFP